MDISLAASRVYLIGLMGAGKSTVGKILADVLDWQLVDIDHEIETLAGSTIPVIFNEQGEDRFREYETQVLLGTAERDKVIIACGGGVVLRSGNVGFLNKEIAVWLDLSPAEAAARVEHSHERPLLEGCDDTLQKLNDILNERRDAYLAASKIHVNSGGRAPEIIATEILRAIELLND